MRDTLKSLKDYQDVLVRIAELEALLSDVPPEIVELEKEWSSIEERIASLTARKSEQETALKAQELALAESNTRSLKFEKDLHEVTNDKEYHAVLKEIDGAKKKTHTTEEAITAINTELEEIQKNLDECQALESESKGKLDAAKSEHKHGQRENQAELEKKIVVRGKLAKGLPERLLKQFNRIASRRNGVGLALCVSAVCGSCNVRVRQNIVDELRKFTRIISCESCKRILYFSDSDEA